MSCKPGGGGRCQEYDGHNGKYTSTGSSGGGDNGPQEQAQSGSFGAMDLLNLPSDIVSELMWEISEFFQNHVLPPFPLKGTYFFGGAGMNGPYIQDMVKAMEEAGISNVYAAPASKFSTGSTITDALVVPYFVSRDDFSTKFEDFDGEGKQFNLIGYSYGSLKVAQAALDYAQLGGKIDNVVLIGSPVGIDMLNALSNNRNIGNLVVKDLTLEGDPIYAGMSRGELIALSPVVALQYPSSTGHFIYSDTTSNAGAIRRRELAKEMYKFGIR